MPSARACTLALVASSVAIASTDAFWLIPGSSHQVAEVTAEQTAAARFRNAIADKYAAVADAASNAIPGQAKPTASSSVVDDLMRAFEEVSADVGYSASVAKGTLGRGIYMRQSEDAYLLAMDVAGLHTREVAITAEKGTLRIKGERKCPTLVATGKPDPLCIPRHYDASFTFPSDADEDKADGRLDAGVVNVFVPKVKGPRGVGRVIKLSGDAAEYLYTESGVKRVVDTTSEGANSAAASVAAAAAAASASAAAAYDSAAATANRVVDNVVGSVYGAADTASVAAIEAANAAKKSGIAATASVKSVGADATASAKSVGAEATAAASRASAAAAASASAASASIKSAAAHGTASAKSAGHAASKSAKSAASVATETATPGFVERLKERLIPTGSAEGHVAVQKEEL